jgi:hypothetical protein
MDTNKIIAEIDAELVRLQQAKNILSSLGNSPSSISKRSVGRPKKVVAPTVTVAPKKRIMSAEGKAKIAAAQRARWAKSKKTALKTEAVPVSVKPAPIKAAKKTSAKKAAKAFKVTEAKK